MNIAIIKVSFKTSQYLSLSFRYLELIGLQSNRVHFTTIHCVVRLVEVSSRTAPTDVHELIIQVSGHAITYNTVAAAPVGTFAVTALRGLIAARLHER